MRQRRTLVVGDDHRILGEGLVSLLSSQFEVVGTAVEGHGLLELSRKRRPEVVIADLSMPGLSGIEVTRELRRSGVAAKVVLLTMHAVPAIACEALRAGANAYVLKHSSAEELVGAIRLALAGGIFVSPMISAETMSLLTRPRGPELRMTSRQQSVVELIAEGMTMKEVGARLGLSSRTVADHKYAAMRTMGVTTTAELVRLVAAQEVGGAQLMAAARP